MASRAVLVRLPPGHRRRTRRRRRGHGHAFEGDALASALAGVQDVMSAWRERPQDVAALLACGLGRDGDLPARVDELRDAAASPEPGSAEGPSPASTSSARSRI